MPLPSSNRRRRRLGLWLLASCALSSGTPAWPQTRATLSGGPELPVGPELTAPAAVSTSTPDVLSGFSSVDRWHLAAAFRTALEILAESDRCRALFDELDLPALPALADTLYEPARGSLAAVRCRGSVAALTVVHGERTRLCGRFGRMSQTDKAITLIHEALHRAGLRESPPTPGALTARQIRDRILAACSF